MMETYPDYAQTHYAHAHLSSDGSQNFANGFSRGSSTSYGYGEYHQHRYFVDRGEVCGGTQARLCPTSLVDNNNNALNAAGIGFAGNPPPTSSSFVIPEDISVYNQWNWEQQQQQQPILAPAPVYPHQSVKSAASSLSSAVVCSPTAQLPTPAAMAVLLNPNAEQQQQQISTDFEIPQGSAAIQTATRPANGAAVIVRPPVEPVVAVQGVPDSPSREKKHACTMCHKRFDRPSTLRKHLLVHTGEKAFVCDTCGRRFGVASNLNRHVKRCILKPVNSPSSSHKSSSGSPPANSSSTSSSPSTSTSTPPHESGAPKRGRRTAAHVVSPPTDTSNNASCSSTATSNVASTSTPKPPGQKRRRRAPSPSQWIPATLLNFNLHSEDSYRATTVPLPPVRRNLPREERNSWDENVNHTPYHPGGWNGTLPGPGLGQGIGSGFGGKDVRNVNFGGKGGFMLGRVLVF